MNLLHFIEKKTEMMVSCSTGLCTAHPVDLGLMASYLKPKVSNLGFKLDWLIGAVVESSFCCCFYLREQAKVKPLFSQEHFQLSMHLRWITV